jgi:DNA helicase-2/ATP-dependent DNA helicase PcrA
MRSSFLNEIPAGLLKDKATIRLRGSGQAFDRPTAAERRPGVPFGFQRTAPSFADEDVSQDSPRFVKGERVKHARFGAGSIVELGGTGKETKVTIDFDDEEIGRKRLVVAFANLQRAND